MEAQAFIIGAVQIGEVELRCRKNSINTEWTPDLIVNLVSGNVSQPPDCLDLDRDVLLALDLALFKTLLT